MTPGNIPGIPRQGVLHVGNGFHRAKERIELLEIHVLIVFVGNVERFGIQPRLILHLFHVRLVEQDTVLFFRVHAGDHGHFQFAVFLQNVARLFGDMVCIALADGGENMLAVLF